MLCSKLVLSFACLYFVVSGHLFPFRGYTILRTNLASIEKSAAGKVTLPKVSWTPLQKVTTWQRCALTGFGIFWIRIPAASNRIRSEVFFPVAGSGLELDFVFTEKNVAVCLVDIYLPGRKQESDCLHGSWYRIRIGFGFKICKTGLDPDSRKSESEHLYYIVTAAIPGRDDHSPVFRLDIRQDSEFPTGYGYPKTAFKRQPDTDIQSAFIDISRIQTFGKSYPWRNHSFIVFRSIFSAFCAMTPCLSMVQSLYHSVIPFPLLIC